MLSRLALLIVVSPLLLASASAPVTAEAEPFDNELKRAQAEAQAADAEVRRLEQAAAKARDKAARLAAQQQAAAAAIAASEARLSAADARARLAQALVSDRAARLARQQAPLAALLAGIVTMGRRPPLLSSADSNSLAEFVRVRALLDTTLPVIRRRSAALSADLAESRKLEAAAAGARNQLVQARRDLEVRKESFAALESKATQRAASLGASAIGASDMFVASAESAARIGSNAKRRRAELDLAADLGVLPAAPKRPGRADSRSPPLTYTLPLAAQVLDGMGSVSETGIRSRGLSLQAYSGQDVRVPADGTIAFAGPFRRHDGVIIIDHGHGWMTMMTGVRTQRRKGDRVQIGQPLGRALGPVTVELSANGTPASAALIAGSSRLLSIKGNSG